MNKLPTSILGIILFALLLTPLATAEEIVYEFISGEYEIVQNDQGYDEIRMLSPGYSLMASPGNPALPEQISKFQLPADADPSGIVMTYEIMESSLLSDIDLLSVPPQSPVQRPFQGNSSGCFSPGHCQFLCNLPSGSGNKQRAVQFRCICRRSIHRRQALHCCRTGACGRLSSVPAGYYRPVS